MTWEHSGSRQWRFTNELGAEVAEVNRDLKTGSYNVRPVSLDARRFRTLEAAQRAAETALRGIKYCEL